MTSTRNLPLLLRPAFKDYIWGGSRLNDEYNLNIPVYPFAEAWVCSTHPDGISTVPGMAEKSLTDVLLEHPEYLGTHPLEITDGKPELPILIKLIDAKKDLSVQVHPDDEYAAKHENSRGKTEMWYILKDSDEAEIVYGFRKDVTKDEVRASIDDGTIDTLLNHIPVRKNELYFIESGTVHAIGAGCLIAEIQQSSNLTYRFYDYGRVDKNGKARPLHIDKALDVANLSAVSVPRQPMRVLKYTNGCAGELLSRCKYFQVERLLINTEDRKLASFKTGRNSFHVLLCVDGCGDIFGDDFTLNFFKGDCIFVPAASIPLTIHGNAQLLNVSC